MRLRRFQFSLTMLLALVTLSTVGVDYFRRRQVMLNAARHHRFSSFVCEFGAHDVIRDIEDDVYWASYPPVIWSRGKGSSNSSQSQRPLSESKLHNYLRLSTKADYHREMTTRYRRAAWFPWMPVNEDAHVYSFFREPTDK